MSRHVLILGGTEEGYALAEALVRRGRRVTTSLAGRTASPRPPLGGLRVGGFGGPGAMAQWLNEAGVTAVIDATHPFAARITAAAAAAAARQGVPILRLERPPWRPGPDDRWIEVEDVAAALERLLGLGAARVLAAIGRGELSALADTPGIAYLVRSVTPPAALPANAVWRQGRGPFALDDETALLRAERIEALLCRMSGGEGGRAKLDAARILGLPVVMLRRPPGVASAVASVEEALAWLERRPCPRAGDGGQ